MAYTSRPLAWPDAHHFLSLFRVVPKGAKGVPWVFEDYRFSTGKRRMETIAIGPFLSVRPTHDVVYVRPLPKVVEDIKRNMLAAGPRDQISFEIVVRDLDEALVVAANSAIIGSRWLALIKPHTLPGFASRRALDALRHARGVRALGRRSAAADAYEVAADALEEEDKEAWAEMARAEANKLRGYSSRDPRWRKVHR